MDFEEVKIREQREQTYMMESDKGGEAVHWLASAKWLLYNGTVDGGRL